MVKKIIFQLKSQRGAASVLVVFMMIIMVTFGALSLTAALANQRLGEKPGMWLTAYYDMDARAGALLAKIDAVIYDAELDTRKALAEGLQGSDMDAFNADFTEYYLSAVTDRLDALSKAEPLIDEVAYNTFSGKPPRVTFIIDGPEDGMTQKFIIVRLDVAVPEYELASGGGAAVKKSEDRYVIREWREWQEPFVDNSYKHDDMWDGSIDGFDGLIIEEDDMIIEE